MDGTSTKPRLLNQPRLRIRYLHYSLSTERTCVHWARQFILFHGKRHPSELVESHVVAFLNYLASERGVSASTQNQALNAVLFLYKEVLAKPL